MKVILEDNPVKDSMNGGSFHIRLHPETVAEVAALSRPLVVGIQPTKYQQNVNGDSVNFVVCFESYNPGHRK